MNNKLSKILVYIILATTMLNCKPSNKNRSQEAGEPHEVTPMGHLQEGGRPEQPPTAEELLKKMDINNDGKLSETEVEGPLKKDFSKIDTNKDSFLSKEEIEKGEKPGGKPKH